MERISRADRDTARKQMMIAARIMLSVALPFVMYEATIPSSIKIAVTEGDKILHAITFYTIALLADFAFPRNGFVYRKIVPILLYGLLIEFVQSFLPYRTASAGDLLANLAGVVAYACSIPLLKRSSRPREKYSGYL